MKNNLFRQGAIKKLSSPDELDKVLQVTSPRGWLALAALAFIVVVAVIWGIFGTIPIMTPTGGILVNQNGIQEAKANKAGLLTALFVKVGDNVKTGQLLGTLKSEDGTETDLKSDFAGTVLDLPIRPDTTLKTDTVIARYDLSDQPLQGIVLVPLSLGKSLHPGLKVQVSPTNVRSDEFGYIHGTISYVSELPVTAESLLAQIKNPQLVQALLSSGTSIQVTIKLEKDSNFSGLKWSSQRDPQLQLTSGTLFRANVLIGEQSPLSLVLPIGH